jgi:predicted nuclease with TOPRIM domain
MMCNSPDRIRITVNIPEDAYGWISNVIKTHELEETDAIKKVISVGLLKLKIDMITKENTFLSSQVENLQKEIKRLTEENIRLEELCGESRRDSNYIYKRLEILNSENEKMEVLVRQQSSVGRKGN